MTNTNNPVADVPALYVCTRTTDEGPVIESVNDEVVEVLGYDRESLVGEPLTTIYTTESVEELESGGYDRALAGRFENENRDLLRQDGTVVNTLLRATPRQRAAGTHAVYIDVTRRRAREAAVTRLHDASQTLFTAGSPGGVARAVCDALESVLSYTITSVRLYDEERESLVPTALGEDRHTIGSASRYSLDESAAPVRAFTSGAPVVVDDRVETIDNTDYASASIHAPLGDHGVVGVLTTAREGFDETDLELVELLAVSATTALDRLDRERRLRDRERKLLSFLEIIHEIIGTDDAAAACKLTVEAVSDVFDMPIAAIWEYDEAATALAPVFATVGAYETVGEIPTFTAAGDSLVWQRFQEGTPAVYSDVREETAVHNPDTPIRAEVIIPLGSFGVLVVGDTETNAFDRADVAFANIVARYLEAALARIDQANRVADAHDRLRFALEGTGTGLLEWDLTAGALSFGPGATDVFELSEADAADDDVPPGLELDVDTLVASVAESDGVFEDELLLTLPNGERRWFELRARENCTSTESVNDLTALVHEVTDRKTREQQLQILNRLMRHNLRNDLTLLLGLATELERAAKSEAVASLAGEIRDIGQDWEAKTGKVKRIRRLLERDPGQPSLPLNLFLERLRANFEEDHPDAAISVDDRSEGGLYVHESVGLGIKELIENAIEHGDRPAVDLVIESDDGWGTVTVMDDGDGIPEHERAVLNEGRETPLKHGSGLGLWLAHLGVTHVGGALEFDDDRVDGASVSALFPVVRTNTDQEREQTVR
ncbi:GAF domain-containing protein [Haloarchaeobius sp. TZWWS8]|uniref:GAF domain-containing protein n=1 Tax=Haloarchaeobius sp. TZWWS8 TaxID=3446121 RepID=UPI003EBF3944